MKFIAIDVGGTFTDVIYMDEEGKIRLYKGSTTPKNPEIGVYEGLKRFEGYEIDEVVHATTIATNSLLGQMNLELPKTALFTTKGFRDLIEIGRQNRPRLYDLFFEKPRQLVPRELRFEVSERVNAMGEIIAKVREEEVDQLAIKAIESKVESIAISFLHSYINPENERATKKVLQKYFKYISVSYEVSPEPREYERTSTTIINAVLKPIVSRYLESLKSVIYNSLKTERTFVMSSSGGLIDLVEASERPVQMVESGPAAGVVGVSALSKFLGIRNAISFDMGGTTAKAGAILDQEIEVTSEYEIGGEVHYGRIVKGSGYPIRFPFIDIAEVSSGGGTIIWKDEGGALRVGPLSSGADPGPMCYGKGGTKPTITDANLILGRIGEELLSGGMKLDKNASITGLSSLGDPYQVAIEAINLANLEMARAIRLVTVERGLDPSDFTLFAFGGAGPQHSLDLAEELEIREVIIPPYPGLFSALGLLFADKKFEARTSFPKNLEEEFLKLERRILESHKKVDYFLRYADIRYQGQGWELNVPLPRNVTYEEAKRRFEEKHESVYGFKLEKDIEIVTITVFGVISSMKPRIPDPPKEGNPKVKKRKAFIDNKWEEVDVFRREELPLNFIIEGPAIIEEYSSTIVVKPKWIAEVGKMGILRIYKS
jgi:N-methylhydantoinase A